MRSNKLSAIALCLLLCCACAATRAQDLSTPETAVRSFLAAFYTADLKKAVACIEGAEYSSALVNMSQELAKHPSTYKVFHVQYHVVANTASVSIVGEVSCPPGKPLPYNSPVKLRRGSKGWLIYPTNDKRLALADAQDIVKVHVWELIHPQTSLETRDKARAVNCLSNLKQLVLGVLMYLQDHSEKYPFSAAGYKKAILVYIKSEKPFHCPSDGTGVESYSFNPHIAGISDARIAEPAKIVALYEGKAGKLNFKHDGKAGVAFADGHCKLVTEEEAKKLRWMP